MTSRKYTFMIFGLAFLIVQGCVAPTATIADNPCIGNDDSVNPPDWNPSSRCLDYGRTPIVQVVRFTAEAQRAINAARAQEEMVKERTREAESTRTHRPVIPTAQTRIPVEMKERPLGCLRIPPAGALRHACQVLENEIENILEIIRSCGRGDFQFEGTCEMAEANLEMAYDQADVLDMVIEAGAGNYGN